MIQSIEYKGHFVKDCSRPGESRRENVFPTNPNAIQVSRNRFLILFEIRGLRGTDDQRSIGYQLRYDHYNGPILREGILAKAAGDWDPLGDGKKYERQHGSPVAFGVPKGAILNGRRAPNENLFVIKWRRNARVFDSEGGFLTSHQKFPELWQKTMRVEWMQFRLNQSEDDLEIILPTQMLRQKGYESGDVFCERNVQTMNQTFVQPVPLNRECTEWADVCHFSGGIAATRYRFNEQLGQYEWVETGPTIQPGHGGKFSEASLIPDAGGWIVAARSTPGPIGWMRTGDLFGETPAVTWPEDIYHNGPVTAFRCVDGTIRLFTGDMKISPYQNGRNPLYCWEIDPDRAFKASNRRIVLDTLESGLPFPILYEKQVSPLVDYGKVLPHTGGSTQLIAMRIRTNGLLAIDPDYSARLHRPTQAEIDASGAHYAELHYTESYPPQWRFSGRQQAE